MKLGTNLSGTVKILKTGTSEIITVFVLKTQQLGVWCYKVVLLPKDVRPKDAVVLGNSVDPGQTAPAGAV